VGYLNLLWAICNLLWVICNLLWAIWICCERFEFDVSDLNLLWAIWIWCERFEFAVSIWFWCDSCGPPWLTDINLPPLTPDADNNFEGSLGLDSRKCWRHVRPKNSRHVYWFKFERGSRIQSREQLSVTHSAAPRVPLFYSYHILTSSVIYYWTDAWQHGIYLLNSLR